MEKVHDYIKSYPNMVSQEICENIVKEFTKHVLGKSSKEDLVSRRILIYDDHIDKTTYNLMCEGFQKGKERYKNEFPNMLVHFGQVSGEAVGVFEDIVEKVRIQYYPKDGYMSEHVDGSFQMVYFKMHKDINLEYRHSQLSAILLLNDDYEGGEFKVAGKIFRPTTGTILIFPSNFMYPHEVKLVTKGNRWSAGTWLR